MATYVHPGAVFRASNPVIRGREAFFTPLTLIAEFEPDLPLTEMPVRVVGLADADTAFSWAQVKVSGTFRTAETSLYNVGE